MLFRKIHRKSGIARSSLKVKGLLVIPFLGIFAWPQTGHGTLVVVFGLNDGNISVAADSRGMIGYYANDHTCKIATVGDKLVVAGTGEYGHLSHGRWDWTAIATAHRTFDTFSKAEFARKDFSTIFVERLMNALVKNFNNELRISPKEVTTSAKNNILWTQIVIGPDEKGTIGEWVTFIKLRNGTTKGSKVAYNLPTEHRGELPVYLAAGETDIANEIFYRKTARGIQWQGEIKAASANLPIGEQSNFIARSFVDYSIRYLPPRVIGVREVQAVFGPIDSLTIDTSGRIRWGEHKAECQ